MTETRVNLAFMAAMTPGDLGRLVGPRPDITIECFTPSNF